MTCPHCHRPIPAAVVVDAGTVVEMYELYLQERRNHRLIEATEPILYVCVERTALPKEPAREHTAEQPA